MNKDRCYEALEEAFVATFLKELIPGMLHNFANLLGGIMGRSKLLKKRLDENMEKTRRRYPDVFAEVEADFGKMKTDVEAINSESDKFYAMFREFSGKFYALTTVERGMINLSSLIEQEVRFADFYLDFKHDVEKTINLDSELPELPGSMSEYSLCISSLIRHSLTAMRLSHVKKFLISTSHDNENVFFKVQYTGPGISEEQRMALRECMLYPSSADGAGDLLNACSILKRYGACCEIQSHNGSNTLSVTIPHTMGGSPA